jgi:GR25 family glycosyltransferase involved in LPS biosynthesis
MIHDLVDKVYAINLPQSKARRANIEKQCFDQGIKYEIFPAIDGIKNNVEWFESEHAKNVHGWTQGAAGLVYTTIGIIKDAKEKGYKSILILEDDIIFKPQATMDIENCVKALPNDWELFHFAVQNFRSPQRVGRHLSCLRGAWSCQAYMVSERIYDEYLKWLELVDRPIDSITAEKIHPRGRSFSPVVNQIITQPNMSEIRKQYMNYNA